MKKFTSLLIGVSLALAGAAYAQQTEESPAAGGKKGKEKTTEQAEPKTPKTQGATTGAEPGTGTGHKGKAKAESSVTATGAGTGTGAQTGAGATTETGVKGKHGRAKAETSTTGAESATGASGQTGAGATTETGAGVGKGKHGRAKAETSAATGTTGTGVSAEAGASASVAPGGKKAGHEKGMKAGAGAGANAKASAAPSASAAPTVAATGATGGTGAMGVTGQQTTGANANVATGGGATAHVEKQKVEQVKQQAQTIKQQHVNFKAQPRPDRAPAVTFNVNYRIAGSDRWSGPQYEVFRTYHPERHDRGWYHTRYQRIELIAGGYYFWNNGYWYPAWGYDPGQEYYAYDAPIYVGHRAEPPDRVIADVQAELQQMGYYRGEVDGLLGPLTREALEAYQDDNGLQVTAVIDEPTLDSLDMG